MGCVLEPQGAMEDDIPDIVLFGTQPRGSDALVSAAAATNRSEKG